MDKVARLHIRSSILDQIINAMKDVKIGGAEVLKDAAAVEKVKEIYQILEDSEEYR